MIRPRIGKRRMHNLAIVIKIMLAVTCTTLLLVLLEYSSPAPAISQVEINGGPGTSSVQGGLLASSDDMTPEDTGYPVDIIPLNDATVMITVTGVELTDRVLFANVTIGPGHVKHSYAMTKSVESGEGHQYAIAAGFTPQENITASLTITTTDAQLAALDFDRAYVPFILQGFPPDEVQDRYQRFGLYIDGGTFPDDNYMTLIPDPTVMPAVPDGYTLLGDIFDINSLGDMPSADKFMEVRFYPDTTWLNGHALQTLAILMRDPSADEWVELMSGRRKANKEQRVAITSKFTAYALVATSRWTDSFSFLDGLDSPEGVRTVLSTGGWALALDEESTAAEVMSIPISLPSAGLQWASVEFTETASLPTTSLQVDVLDVEGAVLREDIEPITDLSEIDPALHPVLRLRAILRSQTLGASPTLDEWRIAWEQRHVEEFDNIYLPIVIK